MNKQVEMVFWDVQHGHSTYIKSPNDKYIIVDLGTGSHKKSNREFSPIRHLKSNWKVEQLECLIITHPHLDHIDDILNIDLLNPRNFIRPVQLTNSEVMSGVRESDKPKFRKYCNLNNKHKSIFNTNYKFGEMNIKIFSPISCAHSNFNNHSSITIIEYAGIKVVIPGDNEKCSFDELLSSRAFKNSH